MNAARCAQDGQPFASYQADPEMFSQPCTDGLRNVI